MYAGWSVSVASRFTYGNICSLTVAQTTTSEPMWCFLDRALSVCWAEYLWFLHRLHLFVWLTLILLFLDPHWNTWKWRPVLISASPLRAECLFSLLNVFGLLQRRSSDLEASSATLAVSCDISEQIPHWGDLLIGNVIFFVFKVDIWDYYPLTLAKHFVNILESRLQLIVCRLFRDTR